MLKLNQRCRLYVRLQIVFLVFAGFFLIFSHTVIGGTVSLNNLVFDPPAMPTNEFDVTLATDAIGSDTDTAELSGFATADLDFQMIGGTFVPSGLTLTGGQVALSDLSFSYLFNTVEVTTIGLVGTPGTPLPPGAVTNGAFDAAEHTMLFDQGVVSGGGTSVDLSTMPIVAPGMGTGQVSVVQVGMPGPNQFTYEATISLPVALNESFEIPDVPLFGTINATISGSGVAVSREQFTITLLPGDFNADQALDCLDLIALEDEVAAGSADLAFDVDSDGMVGASDVTFWLDDLAMALDADANLDGFVDATDFIVWNDNRFTMNDHWCSGNFNQDGFVDAGDFIIWNNNRFTGGDAVVPEPSSMLLALASLTFWRRRA